MALEIKLNQKLTQSLVMTPQLQQAIKLLQLGRAEYLEMLERELLENPVLEDARDDNSESEGKMDIVPSELDALLGEGSPLASDLNSACETTAPVESKVCDTNVAPCVSVPCTAICKVPVLFKLPLIFNVPKLYAGLVS